MIESNDELFEALDRGQGIYIITYRDNGIFRTKDSPC